jgi:hypothetical protein
MFQTRISMKVYPHLNLSLTRPSVCLFQYGVTHTFGDAVDDGKTDLTKGDAGTDGHKPVGL